MKKRLIVNKSRFPAKIEQQLRILDATLQPLMALGVLALGVSFSFVSGIMSGFTIASLSTAFAGLIICAIGYFLFVIPVNIKSYVSADYTRLGRLISNHGGTLESLDIKQVSKWLSNEDSKAEPLRKFLKIAQKLMQWGIWGMLAFAMFVIALYLILLDRALKGQMNWYWTIILTALAVVGIALFISNGNLRNYEIRIPNLKTGKSRENKKRKIQAKMPKNGVYESENEV